MTKDLGVWTAEDCALVLIDYQNEMFEVIRSERRPPTWSSCMSGCWPRPPRRMACRSSFRRWA